MVARLCLNPQLTNLRDHDSMDHFERRRDRFTFFDRMQSPAVSVCFRLDLPDLRPWCRANCLGPFHVLLHAVLRSVLQVENFRYRILDGEVIRIDRLVPSYTVVNHHGDLNFAQFDWSDDVREFVARSTAARIEAEAMDALNEKHTTKSPRDAKDQVFVTCMPWLDFTSLQHPMLSLAAPDIPSLAWGRFRDVDGGLQLPFSVQAHHGFVDGYHIHLLAQRIAAEVAGIIG